MTGAVFTQTTWLEARRRELAIRRKLRKAMRRIEVEELTLRDIAYRRLLPAGCWALVGATYNQQEPRRAVDGKQG